MKPSERKKSRVDLKAVLQYAKLVVIPKIAIYYFFIYSVDKIKENWFTL